MQKPTWAVAVGIIGIVFGCFGLLGAGQTVMMPTILEMQKKMFTGMQADIRKDMERRKEAAQKKAGGAEETEMGAEEGAEKQGESRAEQPATAPGKAPACEYPPVDMFNFMETFWSFPPWYKTWSIAAGITGVFVSGFYILASIFLLLVRRSGIKLFYWAAGTSIVFSLTKAVVAVMANPLMGVSMMVWSIVGIVISAVLLIVVATSDKQAFGYAPKLAPPTA